VAELAQLAARLVALAAGGDRTAAIRELQARVPRERAGLARGPGCRLGVPAGK